jgi:hypothetical protein
MNKTETIKEEIELLEKDIRHIIDLVVDFTNYSSDKFIEIAQRETTANSG